MLHLRSRVAACLVVLFSLTMWVSPVAAHTGFESSDPADGAVLDAPVEVITLVFTGDAEPTGAGFEILQPSGEIRQPTEASTADGRTWVLTFDPALSGGVIGVRWMVKAPDAHPIDGSFSFAVPDAVESPLPDSEAIALDSQSGDEPDDSDAVVAQPRTEVLDEFLRAADDGGGSAQRTGAFARFVTLIGTLVGVGGLVFAATTMRGRRHEVRHVLFWVRRAGVVVVVGAAIEFVSQVAVEGTAGWSALWSPSSISGAAWSTFGVATLLRLGGGLALAAGPRLDTAPASEVVDPVAAMGVLVGAGSSAAVDSFTDVVGGSSSGGLSVGPDAADHAWRAGPGSLGAAVGAVAVTGAHLFDGHTVTKGNRWLTGVIDTVHVAGGAIWAGGVVMLMLVLWRRHREGSDLRARQLAVRFSVVASIALVVVGAAGVLLTIIVLDGPSELWATEWGRILIAKTVFVGVAAAAGGYNHKVLIPQLDAAPDSAELVDRFRAVVTGEAAALAIVALLTALLMGASL